MVQQMEADNEQPSHIKILNWNIRNPSIKRAKRQANWIIQTDANIVILTEVKYSEGGKFIHNWLQSYQFNVFFPQPRNNDYCVMIATKGFASQSLVEPDVNFLPHRIVSIVCKTLLGKIKLIGLYVPSRGPREKRNVNKRQFQDQIINLPRFFFNSVQAGNLIIGGDLNVVERNHIPHYPVFGEWEYEFYESFIKANLLDAYRLMHPNTQEYSWFGRKGTGYRFDHFFVSTGLSRHIVDCSFIHTTRSLKLSDHSAMYLEITNCP